MVAVRVRFGGNSKSSGSTACSSLPSSSAVIMITPMTKAARQHEIRTVLSVEHIRSQAELADALQRRGVTVTQGTLSRDLVDIGATRIRTDTGVTVYHVPSEDKTGAAVLAGVQTSDATGARLSALCRDLLLSAE